MHQDSTPHETRAEKLAERISYILNQLYLNMDIDKAELAEHFGVHVRTIERDLTRLKNLIEYRDGKWHLRPALRGTVPGNYLTQYAALVGTEALFPDRSQGYLIAQLEEKHDTGLQIHPMPEEDLGTRQSDFKLLQQAVQQRYACTFQYAGKQRHVYPYRLIHKNGIWYLAAAEQPANQLKNFSLGRMSLLQVHDEQEAFRLDDAHLRYLQQQPDIWFTQRATHVVLHVAEPVAHYFMRRDQLPRQRNQKNSDGSLRVETHIYHQQQLFPIVRYWMPHVRIITPTKWAQELIGTIEQTLAQWQNPSAA